MLKLPTSMARASLDINDQTRSLLITAMMSIKALKIIIIYVLLDRLKSKLKDVFCMCTNPLKTYHDWTKK